MNLIKKKSWWCHFWFCIALLHFFICCTSRTNWILSDKFILLFIIIRLDARPRWFLRSSSFSHFFLRINFSCPKLFLILNNIGVNWFFIKTLLHLIYVKLCFILFNRLIMFIFWFWFWLRKNFESLLFLVLTMTITRSLCILIVWQLLHELINWIILIVTLLSFLIIYPLSSINPPVNVEHLSITVLHIIHKVSLIKVSILPSINSISLFFILDVLPLIFVSVSRSSFPNSFSIS